MTRPLDSIIPSERSRARNRLLIALTLILSTSFIGVSLINYSLTKAAVHKQIIDQDLPLTRDNIYSDLSGELARPTLVASSMATNTFLKDWAADGEREADRIIRYLREIHEQYHFFSTFFVSQKTRKYYHFKGLHKVISPGDHHDVWYYTFTRSNKPYVLDVDTDEASQNVLTVFINYKVFDDQGVLLGVTGVGVQVDSLAHLISNYQLKYGRTIYLTDTDGVIQVHQNQSLIEKKSILQIEGMAPLAGQILRTGETPTNFKIRRKGADIQLTVRYIPQLDWFLFVEQNETDTLAQARMTLLGTIIIGALASIVIIGLALATINRYQRRLEAMATTDALTGVSNRRVLENEFVRFVYLNGRNDQPFSVVLIDLDGFKTVNDQLGHVTGDLVLKQVADMICLTMRPTDTVARWGGDEFVVLTALDGPAAANVARRIGGYVADKDLAGPDAVSDDPRHRITLSCGIAQFRQGDNLDSLLRRADKAMYQCKVAGGDGVQVFEA